MKLKILIIALTASLLGIGSCRQNDPTPGAGEPVVTEPGEPTGAAVSASIGPAGGSLTSADGTVSLQVPAGALDAATTISIQPITNNAPLGVAGGAYRFSPDGQRFKVPVKLTFRYTDEMLGGSSPELFWILTQAADGSWQALLTSSVNASARTVSSEIEHFSDWVVGRFAQMTLIPSQFWLRPGESAELQVTGFVSTSRNSSGFAPVSLQNSQAIGSPILTPDFLEDGRAKYTAGQWRLAGEGQLQGNGLTAKYTAPGRMPTSQNPVAVSTELIFSGSNTKLMLVSNITIIEDDILSVTVDGVTYKAKQFGTDPNMGIAYCGRGQNGVLSFGGNNAQWAFALGIAKPRGGAVVLSNCKDGDGAEFGLFDGSRAYDYLRITRTGTTTNCRSDGGVCPGSITVTFDSYRGEKFSPVIGRFSGTIYDNKVTGCRSSVPHSVSGYFNLMLIN